MPAPSLPQRVADFNGDGYADLAIGVPYEDLGTISDAGVVHVLYGSATAPNILSSTDDEKWTQNIAGVRDTAESGDKFGSALAWGDFDGDAYGDLAIGIWGEDIGTVSSAGAVAVLYGSASGLTADGDEFFSQNSAGIEDTAEGGDNFGYALAVGNFSYPFGGQVGADDLAIGVRSEDLGTGKKNAGAVAVIYSDNTGLDDFGNQLWTQDSSSIEEAAETGDRFGSSLAVGDFIGVGAALAIGVPDENIGAAVDAGGVNVIQSYFGGLASDLDEFWSQDTGAVTDVAETDDHFGYALASTNFGASFDLEDDLAIGVYGEDNSEGAVNVLTGDPDGGLTDTEQYFLTQQIGGEEAGAKYGYALAAGEFAPSFVPVLAIGAPGDDLGDGGSIVDGGSVTTQYWSNGGPGNAAVWTQDSLDIEDTAEQDDEFGSSLMLAATTGTYKAMLAIGVPFEDVGAIADAGGVNIMYGDSVDFDASDDQHWTQDSESVYDSAEASDRFGSTVA